MATQQQKGPPVKVNLSRKRKWKKNWKKTIEKRNADAKAAPLPPAPLSSSFDSVSLWICGGFFYWISVPIRLRPSCLEVEVKVTTKTMRKGKTTSCSDAFITNWQCRRLPLCNMEVPSQFIDEPLPRNRSPFSLFGAIRSSLVADWLSPLHTGGFTHTHTHAKLVTKRK